VVSARGATDQDGAHGQQDQYGDAAGEQRLRASVDLRIAGEPAGQFLYFTPELPYFIGCVHCYGSFGLDGGLPSDYLTKRTDRGIVETLPG
jgi:hypothetical protein